MYMCFYVYTGGQGYNTRLLLKSEYILDSFISTHITPNLSNNPNNPDNNPDNNLGSPGDSIITEVIYKERERERNGLKSVYREKNYYLGQRALQGDPYSPNNSDSPNNPNNPNSPDNS